LQRFDRGLKNAVETLELAILRGTRPQPGTAGLARDFVRFRDELAKLRRKEVSSLHLAEPRAHLKDAALDRAQSLVDALRTAFAPLEGLATSKPHDFIEIARRHRDVL